MIENVLKEKILLLDGAMGTVLINKNLKAKDFGSPQYEGCNEQLNLSRPDIVTSVHTAYLEAGADIIETNSFAGSSITLSEFGLQDKAYEINFQAAKLAKDATRKWSTSDWPRFVAGAIGPTNKTITVTQNISFDALEESYYQQAKALYDGGVDLFIVETVFDTLNAKAAYSAIHKLFLQNKQIPLIISITIEQTGTMLAGQDIEAAYISLEHMKPLAFSLNCATGPDLMKPHLKTLSSIATTYVACFPNAGLPLEDGTFPLGASEFSQCMERFMQENLVNIVGGCCGTTPEHIATLRSTIDHNRRREIPFNGKTTLSGTEALILEEDNRPIIVGERTNVIGSKKFKRLITEENFDIASEIGKSQVDGGAQVVDVCLANPDRNEIEDAKKFYPLLTQKIKPPIMIDSTQTKVIEEALKRTQGKSIINSLNFEDGLERINQVMPHVKKFGAAIVFGTIDEDKEQAMAVTVERKLAIAKRAYELLVHSWGIPKQDIIFDPLVFPIGVGDKKYVNSAKDTVTAIATIKQACPGSKTILGISNVSFGLPPAGRQVLNSIFLYHATLAGLDYAIVNAEKLMRYPSIPEKEKLLAENVLFNRGADPITPFVEHFRGVKELVPESEKLPLEQRLPLYIIEGRREGLENDLHQALQTRKPLDIINGPLMKGMEKVGKLFNQNKLIVSEVLQSAESMKFAVSVLEPHMDKDDDAKKGLVIIATVKGDVHDIGKNLFQILLKNNRYEVIDLGIKVPPEELIAACKKYNPDIIGLSGLLVKSAQMMTTTVDEFAQGNLSVPVLVGGAALTERYTYTTIANAYKGIVAYAKDAMTGLDFANALIENKQQFAMTITQRKKELENYTPKPIIQSIASSIIPSIAEAIPRLPPDLDTHILEQYSLDEIFSYINPQMLYGVHLGMKGNIDSLQKQQDPKLLKLVAQVDEVKKIIKAEQLLKPKAIFQFFNCNSVGNTIEVELPNGVMVLPFERQTSGQQLCVSDFVAKKSKGKDSMGFFVVTAGQGVLEKAKEWRDGGEYLKSHILQVLALESAEAFAEIVHKKMRKLWGIDKELPLKDIFWAKYSGIRLSYGYPACRDINEQQKLFLLLKPEQIGVQLSEGMMMDPEASVSALVFSHPEGKYFNV